jgi:hypothetical protein
MDSDQDPGGPKKHTDPTDSDQDPQHWKKALTFTYSQDDAEEVVEAEEEAKRWSGQGGQVAFSYEEPPRGQQPSAVPEVTDLPAEDRYCRIFKFFFKVCTMGDH